MDPFESRHSDELSAILALADNRTFAAAARVLERHPSVVSKRITSLEMRLGVRLVERSTRAIRFTDVGARFVENIRAAARLIVEAQSEALQDSSEIRGTLRLSLPSAMGRMWLSPLISEFAKCHPHLCLELDYTDNFVDIVSKGHDLAIRLGDLPDSQLIARKLCDQTRIICVSPRYREHHGEPMHPHDLLNHKCLSFTGFSSFPDWPLRSGDKFITIRPRALIRSNDNEGLLSAAINGLGVVAGSTWLVAQAIKEGRLVRILPDWTFGSASGVYLVRPSSDYVSAKVEAFKAYIESKFANGPPWGDLKDPLLSLPRKSIKIAGE
ncbi:LysR family transcriptional regulator [Pseudomonas marginalis]|uniref:LysR family transcriptional regulator n=1 Tax=Pseudomonas marginalis TaxID=298 RepID=UPI0024812BE1|nr:LysR family transcriptional regulator [Pseudomonas marginalis]WGT28074.1 LysR family transcriptional regulator [Pseudomonas marginalis]